MTTLIVSQMPPCFAFSPALLLRHAHGSILNFV